MATTDWSKLRCSQIRMHGRGWMQRSTCPKKVPPKAARMAHRLKYQLVPRCVSGRDDGSSMSMVGSALGLAGGNVGDPEPLVWHFRITRHQGRLYILRLAGIDSSQPWCKCPQPSPSPSSASPHSTPRCGGAWDKLQPNRIWGTALERRNALQLQPESDVVRSSSSRRPPNEGARPSRRGGRRSVVATLRNARRATGLRCAGGGGNSHGNDEAIA